MGHTPYGYSIENGCATIKEDEAYKIRKLYENYLSGMALAKAAAAAGIETYHGTAKRLMENRHYLGDDFYPAIIDQETYDKAAAIRLERAGKLGRLNRKKERGVCSFSYRLSHGSGRATLRRSEAAGRIPLQPH